MDTIKDRNGKDIREEEEIKKRWKGYTEEQCKKKDLNDLDNLHGVVTHLEPDCLKSSLPQRAFLGTKLVEVIEFQLSYFKS